MKKMNNLIESWMKKYGGIIHRKVHYPLWLANNYSFIGEVTRSVLVYKKVYSVINGGMWGEQLVATLELVPGTIIHWGSSPTEFFQGKCRASQVFVVDFHNLRGRKFDVSNCSYVASYFDMSFKYEKDTMVFPVNRFSRNIREECAAGIHFFCTQREARAY